VVADDHILDASTLRRPDRCRRRTQIVAAAAGDVAGHLTGIADKQASTNRRIPAR
jgi:hypothetical protein